MKSIIIIIAIILVTLTAKADWVKSGELDSLYLGDAPITFSKYSPDYTKFVTYSAQDSTLRLWDLATGKVIKERTFEKNYKFSMCEYEFNSEMFVFANNTIEYMNNTNYYSIYLYYINFSDTLKYRLVAKSGMVLNNGYPSSYNSSAKSMHVINNIVQIFAETSNASYNGNLTYSNIGGAIYQFEFTKDTLFSKSLGALSPFTIDRYSKGYCLFGFNQHREEGSKGGVRRDTTIVSNGITINFGDRTKSFDDITSNIVLTKYPFFSKTIYSLDIGFNYLVFGDVNGKINFYSNELDTLTHLRLPYKLTQFRKLKLIHSQRYSIFFKDLNKLLICDNQQNQILDTINLPEGNLGYKEDSSLVYSHKSNTIYKTTLKLLPFSFADIFSNKKVYFKGEKILIKSIIPDNISDFKITVNDSSFFHTSLKLDLPVGYYNVKLFYKELGKQNIVTVDSMFQVVDSLRATYKVTHSFNNNAKYPFHFEAFPTDTSAKVSWGYTWCETIWNGNTGPKSYYYNNYKYGNVVDIKIDKEINLKYTPLRLTLTNAYESVTYFVDLKVMPNLNANFNSYRGFVPFKVKAIYENTSLGHNQVISYNNCGTAYYNKQLIVGNDLVFNKPGNSTDTLNLIIDKPGIYPITMKYLNYLGGITVVHDSVITVLDPTDTVDTSYITDTLSIDRFVFKDFDTMAYIRRAKNANIEIFNQIGQLIREYNLTGDLFLQKEEFDRGLYFVRIQYGSINLLKKFLVE